MPKKPAKHSASYALALRLQAALADDPSLQADMPSERPGGVIEPTAAFEVRDAEGRVFRVIVARQH
jgi:hypothetical protein